jgi:hypothetical protein
VCLVNYSLLIIGQQGLLVPVLASHWLEDFADGKPTTGKTNKTPLIYSEAPAASQTTFIIDTVNYTPLV